MPKDKAKAKDKARKRLRKKGAKKKAPGSVGITNRNQRKQLEAIGDIEKR